MDHPRPDEACRARGLGRPRGPVVRQWVRAQPRRPHAADGALLAQGDERLGAASSSPRPFTPSTRPRAQAIWASRRSRSRRRARDSRLLRGRRRTSATSPTAASPHRIPSPTFHSGTAPRCVPSPRVILPFDSIYRHVVTSFRRSSSVARRGARGRRCRGPRSPRGRRATTAARAATASRAPRRGAARASPATTGARTTVPRSLAATGAGSTGPP